MTTVTDSLLNTGLPLEPEMGEISDLVLLVTLQDAYNAIQILTNEVERIRIATGTTPPP